MSQFLSSHSLQLAPQICPICTSHLGTLRPGPEKPGGGGFGRATDAGGQEGGQTTVASAISLRRGIASVDRNPSNNRPRKREIRRSAWGHGAIKVHSLFCSAWGRRRALQRWRIQGSGPTMPKVRQGKKGSSSTLGILWINWIRRPHNW